MQRVIITTVLFCFALASSAQCAEINGLWLGYERMPEMRPEQKGDRWYYENRLSIADDVVRLEKLPVFRRKGRLMYSASDGAFPVFRGQLALRGGATVAVLEIESCDYCGQLADGAAAGRQAWSVRHHDTERQGEPKDYPIHIVSDHSITLDSVAFHRVTKFP
jgi:hypothetical protein